MTDGIIGDSVKGLVDGILGSPLLTRLADLIPDPVERARQMAEMQSQILDIASKSDLAQLAVDQTEAASENLFVSGWRPFIGWVCGCAFAYHFILQPLTAYISLYFNYHVALPTFDMNTLTTVLFGMLGLGTLRTIDKQTPGVMKAISNK